MDTIRHKVLSSIDMIGKSEWDAIFGDVAEGYNFYKTLENSNLEQFRFFYVTLHRNKETLLIAPLFTAELNFDIVMDGLLADMVRGIRKFIPRFFIKNTLFCGSPFGENGVIGIKENLAGNEKEILISRLTETMERLCKKKNIDFMVFKDFLDRDTGTLDPLKKMRFFKLESLPSIIIDLDFGSMDNYFKLLGHSTRKDLKRKLKKAQAAGNIRIDAADNVAGALDRIYELYLNTYNAGEVKFEKLTKDFFVQISRNFGPHAKFFLYYVDGRLAAFNLCFIRNGLFIDKFIGFDYALSCEHNLYFISWYHNIEWCVNNSMIRYQAGQTDYEPKINLGGERMPLYAYARHGNVFANFLLAALVKLLRL